MSTTITAVHGSTCGATTHVQSHQTSAVSACSPEPQSGEGLADLVGDHARVDAPELDFPREFGSPEKMMIALQFLGVTLQGHLAKGLRAQIKNAESQNKKNLGESLEKLNEIMKKMEEARAAAKRGKIFGWMVKVCSVIVSTVVLAAAVTATGGAAGFLAVVAAAALVGAVAALAGDISGAVNKDAGFTLASKIKDGLGLSNTEASIFADAVTFNLGGLAATGGSYCSKDKEKSAIFSAVFGVLGAIAEVALTWKLYSPKNASTLVAKMSRAAMQVGQVVGGYSSIGQGAAEVDRAYKNKDVAELGAHRSDLQLEMDILQFIINDLLNFSTETQERVDQAAPKVAETLSKWADSMSRLVDRSAQAPALA